MDRRGEDAPAHRRLPRSMCPRGLGGGLAAPPPVPGSVIRISSTAVRPSPLIHFMIPNLGEGTSEGTSCRELAGTRRMLRDAVYAGQRRYQARTARLPAVMSGGRSLLEEELAVHSVRVPLDGHRPPGDVRQERRRDPLVVVDHLRLGQPGFRGTAPCPGWTAPAFGLRLPPLTFRASGLTDHLPRLLVRAQALVRRRAQPSGPGPLREF